MRLYCNCCDSRFEGEEEGQECLTCKSNDTVQCEDEKGAV